MAKRSLLGGSLVLLVGVGAAVACSNYVPPDVPAYGPPNGLTGKVPLPPEVAGEGGAGPTSDDAGSSSGGGEGGGGAQFLCQKSGGTLSPAATCSVSFVNDIFPKMESGGAWNCGGTATGCHGSPTAAVPYLQAAGPSATVPQTAAGYYAVFANFALADNTSKPYFDPCSIDPTQSSFVCNTLATGATGQCGIAMPQGITVAAADTTAIATWVACGAPFN
jgi:hypothetical protein